LTVLYGAKSDTFLPAAAAGLKRALPQVALRCISGAGHLVPLERPSETAEAIVEAVRLRSAPVTSTTLGV
jgi:pimeloyl-ACP methyl ester carboxylesterase